MHPCLQISEIFSCILEQTDVDRYHHTLASIARVCKAFQDPALDLLWNNQMNLGTVMRLLPADCWKEIEGKRGKISLVLRRELRSTDFNRFHIYARRITIIGSGVVFPVRSSSQVQSRLAKLTVCPKALKTLLDFLKRSPLPNLQCWKADARKIPVEQMFQILGPNVTELSMIYGAIKDSMHTLRALASNIKTVCPRVKKFTFSFPRMSREGFDLVSELICKYDQLEDVDAEMTTRGLAHLASLPTLRKVHLHFPDIGVLSSLYRGPAFTGLRNLKLHTSDLAGCSSFLAFAKLVQLENAHFYLSGESLASMGPQFFETLAKSCSHDTLTSLSLTRDMKYVGPAIGIELRRLPKNSLKPLLAFKNLKTLSIDIKEGVDLGDAEFGELTHALAHLEELKFLDHNTPLHPTLTLRGLVHLVKHCLKLESLLITLDARVINWEAGEKIDGGATNPNIMTLLVCNSPIADPKPIAEVLAELFPNLIDVVSISTIHVDEEAPKLSAWTQVREMIRARWDKE